jgi:fructokinase
MSGTSKRQPRCLVVGEALVDIVVPPNSEPTLAPGGSPLNVAVGLARLGVTTELVTEIGDDDLGGIVEVHLDSSHVWLAEDSVVEGRRTNTATARLDEYGAAAYAFDLRWELGPRPLPSDFDAVHVGSLGAALSPGRESVARIAHQAARAGLIVSIDPNVRPALTPDRDELWAGLQQIFELAQLVRLSDEDLAFLRPGEPVESVAGELLRGTTAVVVVTAGGRGAVAFSDHGRAEQPSPVVEVVDTVGAGDSFMAALIAIALETGLDDLDDRRLSGYLEAAHTAAAVTVSRRGADPPWRTELPPDWPTLR